MFCPNCRYEYQEGIVVCPDCETNLVEELPPEAQSEFVDRVTVLETTNHSVMLMAKSLLEDAGIDCFTQGTGTFDQFYSGPTAYNPIVGALKIQVPAEAEEEALQILAEIEEEEIVDPSEDDT